MEKNNLFWSSFQERILDLVTSPSTGPLYRKNEAEQMVRATKLGLPVMKDSLVWGAFCAACDDARLTHDERDYLKTVVFADGDEFFNKPRTK